MNASGSREPTLDGRHQVHRELPVWLLPLCCGFGVLLLYVALAQESFFKSDGHYILIRYLRGEPPYPNHPLNELLLAPFAHALEALGVSAYSAVLLFSAFGTAGAVAFFVASLRGFVAGWGIQILSGAILACLPAVLFFGTTIEFHGPFMLFAGLTWFCATRLALHGKWHWLPLLSVISGLSAGMHSTGHLITAIVIALLLTLSTTQPGLGPRKAIILSAAYLFGHALVTQGMALALNHWVFSSLSDATRPSAIKYLVGHGLPSLGVMLERLPWSLYHEYILPFFPFCFLPLLAIRKSFRREFLALLLPLPPYVLLCLILLGSENEHIEFGAYLLPLAFPLMFAIARTARDWHLAPLALLGLVSLVFSLVILQRSDRSEVYAQRIAQFEEVATPREPVVWCQDLDSLGALLKERPKWEWELCHVLTALPVNAVLTSYGVLDAQILKWLAENRCLIITKSGMDQLMSAPSGTALIGLIRKNFDVQEREHGLHIVLGRQ